MKLKTEFQDEVFRKGEVADVSIATMPDGRIVARAKAKSGGEHTFYYNCIETLCNDWSDHEEPKEYYAIELQGDIIRWARHSWDEKTTNKIKEIGNYFETEEEAEQAVRRLKAWKRLKDKGFKFEGTNNHKRKTGYFINYYIGKSFNSQDECEQAMKDLKSLFGGEE